MKILFISRAYPPIIGGIEKQNYEICKALESKVEVNKIVNRRGKKFLLPFLIVAFYKALRMHKHYDIILLGDGVLAVLAFWLKYFSKVPVVCIVHGLDITYSNFIYRKLWLNIFFSKIDQFIAVGNETIKQAELRNINTDTFQFVPNGVDVSLVQAQYSKTDLEEFLGYNPPGPVLLTLGRLVERKGVSWFIQEVFPFLDSSITYLIAGEGKNKEVIKAAIKASKVGDRIKMLGRISEEEKSMLLSTIDIFIQANIKVENDMEGFGLVVLEAGLFARPVVASKLEGLQDAITENKNGLLLESGNSEQYIDSITELLQDPIKFEAQGRYASEYVKSRFSWDKIADEYLAILEKVNVTR